MSEPRERIRRVFHTLLVEVFDSLRPARRRCISIHGFDPETSFRAWMDELCGDEAEQVIAKGIASGWPMPFGTAANLRRKLPATITPREASALRISAHGLRADEAADAQGVTPQTLKDQLTSARRRLGASSTAQAVAILLVGELSGEIEIVESHRWAA